MSRQSANGVHWWYELRNLDPCSEGLEWARQFPTIGEAWSACTNISWMYWLTGKLGGPECLYRATEVFGTISWTIELINRRIDPDYFRSAYPTPTLVDLQAAVAWHRAALLDEQSRASLARQRQGRRSKSVELPWEVVR